MKEYSMMAFDRSTCVSTESHKPLTEVRQSVQPRANSNCLPVSKNQTQLTCPPAKVAVQDGKHSLSTSVPMNTATTTTTWRPTVPSGPQSSVSAVRPPASVGIKPQSMNSSKRPQVTARGGIAPGMLSSTRPQVPTRPFRPATSDVPMCHRSQSMATPIMLDVSKKHSFQSVAAQNKSRFSAPVPISAGPQLIGGARCIVNPTRIAAGMEISPIPVATGRPNFSTSSLQTAVHPGTAAVSSVPGRPPVTRATTGYQHPARQPTAYITVTKNSSVAVPNTYQFCAKPENVAVTKSNQGKNAALFVPNSYSMMPVIPTSSSAISVGGSGSSGTRPGQCQSEPVSCLAQASCEMETTSSQGSASQKSYSAAEIEKKRLEALRKKQNRLKLSTRSRSSSKI